MKSHNVEDAVLEVVDLLCGDILSSNANDDERTLYANGGAGMEDDDDDETDGSFK